MEPKYREAINNASAELCQALMQDVPMLLEQGLRLDALVRDILRAVGLALLNALYQGLCRYLVEQATARGLTVQTRPLVRFKTLYGEVEVESPYLRSAQSGESARPMKDILGVEGEQYSESVQRALVDFGSEKSFARAVRNFEEHYGWPVGRTTLRHQTLQAAQDAATYLDERLQQATATYEQAGMALPQVPVMLMGLDGCEIRTGIYMKAAEAGMSDRPPHQRVRVESWRDVRTGLARPLEVDERLYVCRMDSYDEVLEQLFGVGCLEGMTPRTQVVVPGDGANGLREAVVSVFPGAQYILDHPHLKSHFYETADALGLEESERYQWVKGYMDQLWACEVDEVLASLQHLQEETPNERLRQLIQHLWRFEDSVDYGAYHACGWPLGSGEIESAHRYLPQERLKIAGACWNPANVNPMLALRVVRANHWWDKFWQWRLERRRVPVEV